MKDQIKHYELTIKAQTEFIDDLIKQRNKFEEENKELKARLKKEYAHDAVMINLIAELNARLKEAMK